MFKVNWFSQHSEDAKAQEASRKELQETEKLKNLFPECKLFLSSEVPREILVFVIRYAVSLGCFKGVIPDNIHIIQGVSLDELEFSEQLAGRRGEGVRSKCILLLIICFSFACSYWFTVIFVLLFSFLCKFRCLFFSISFRPLVSVSLLFHLH